jgi:DNA adenine methylase
VVSLTKKNIDKCKQITGDFIVNSSRIPPLSPLRYPGAKRWLISYIVNVLEYNNLRPKLFIEPFAGGASVSLAMLKLNKVDKIGLSDLDPMLAAFWHTVFHDTKWLIERIQTCNITLEEWLHVRNTTMVDRRELAYKCLFLNRTSFSGILHQQAGPIGGMKQQSKYKIDCRFNKTTIINRIQDIAQYRDRIAFIWNHSWEKAVSEIEKKSKSDSKDSHFYYFDPPFYKKAERLYSFYFKQNCEHENLRNALLTLESNWLLSYDCHNEIELLYTGCNNSQVEIAYTTNGNGKRNITKELIVSNISVLPDKTENGTANAKSHD